MATGMKIEHLALQVPDPVSAAEWYTRNLGLRIVRQSGPPGYGRFLADDGGRTVLEIYNNPKASVPDYRSMSSLQLHIAFSVPDVSRVREALLAAGAVSEGDVGATEDGDAMAMVRDPWGVPLQLVRRVNPIV